MNKSNSSANGLKFAKITSLVVGAILAGASIPSMHAAISEAQVVAVKGKVTSAPPAAMAALVQKGSLIHVGSAIQTREQSELLMAPFPASAIRVVENSSVTITEADFEKKGETILGRKASLNLQRGTAQVDLKKQPGGSIDFQIKAPQCVAAARGTIYQTVVAEDGTETVTVLDGFVRVTYTDDSGNPVHVDVGPKMSFVLKKGADGKVLEADLVAAAQDQLDALVDFSKLVDDSGALELAAITLDTPAGDGAAQTRRLEKQLGTSIAKASTAQLVAAIKVLVAEDPKSAPGLIAAIGAAGLLGQDCAISACVGAAVAALDKNLDRALVQTLVQAIVQYAVQAEPRCAALIVAAAIKEAPLLADAIVEIAVASLPDPTLEVDGVALPVAIEKAALAALQDLPPIGEGGDPSNIHDAANRGLAANLATLFAGATNGQPGTDFQSLGKAAGTAEEPPPVSPSTH